MKLCASVRKTRTIDTRNRKQESSQLSDNLREGLGVVTSPMHVHAAGTQAAVWGLTGTRELVHSPATGTGHCWPPALVYSLSELGQKA